MGKWVTPERQAHLVSLFNRSHGFCVWQEPVCPIEGHMYDVFIEGIIDEWQADTREDARALWKVEQRALHQDEHTSRLGRQFDSIARERFLQQQGSYYLEREGYDGLQQRRVAFVRVPSSSITLRVDVTSALRPLSKNKRRKIKRHGDTPPVEVANRIQELCRQAVRAYLAR